jgi:predicted short-subunit dehydrogenase-like oxidoreductase (DUF2520 family)
MPTVAIVGAGRVGRALGRRLGELGWTIGAVMTRSRPTARAAVRAISGGVAHAGLTRQVLAADVVLVTTPDSAIAAVAAELARLGGEEWRGRVVLHTSGALDRGALAPLERAGAATGSLHPMQTFSGRGTPRLEGVVFGLDGAPRALRVARQMARALGGQPVRIEARRKAAYHAAGGFTAQHLLTVAETGTQLLVSTGFTRRQAVRALLRMARQTLENFERLGPRGAWTGPLARGDYQTLARHVAELRRFPPEFLAAYAALTRLGARVLAPRGGVDRRRLDRILGGT